MNHIYISPHLDDAALSCGGLIANQVFRGESVTVLNVFAGIPNLEYFSAYAQKQHARWNLPPDKAILARREEDYLVLTSLGAEVMNWDYCDAIYRKIDDKFLYTDHQKLFGPLHPAEHPLIDHLTERLSQLHHEYSTAIFYAPLRVGGHVDHLLIRKCAVKLYNRGAKIVFYEDFPYVAKDDWPDEPKTVVQAKAELPFQVQAEYIEIDTQTKIETLKGYQSQMEALYGEEREEGLMRTVCDYTAKLGREGNRNSPCERYWHPQ